MLSYKVIKLSDPSTGIVLHVCRQSSNSHKNHSVYVLVQGARQQLPGSRFDAVRLLRSSGIDPVGVEIAAGLDRCAADRLVDELRTEHDVQLSRRGIRHPRIHQQTDPDSPDLDPSPVYYVYELIRSDKDEVFYVGKGSDRQRPRIDDHVRKAKAGKHGHKFAVIRKLLKMGLKPVERRIAANLTESAALKLEVEHISSIGLDVLTNDASGGQTAPTGDDHWTRKHPEKVLRGENHPWAKDPELARKNVERMQVALKKDPSKRPRGAKHGMAKLGRAQIDEIRALYQRGLDSGRQVTGERLAADVGITPTQISRILRGKSWSLPNLIAKHGNAKLTKAQIASIPERLAAGLNQKELAVEMGVSHSLVNHYAKLAAV